MSATMELAHFVVNKRFADLPPSAIRKAKQCLLDTLGVMVAASGFHYGKKAIPFFVKNGGPGACTLIGCKKKIGPAIASFAHGTLVEVLETQDGVRFGGIHPCSTVIPAALAIGEQSSCSGQDLLAGIILGYEVASRVAASVHPERLFRGFNATGVCGPFGAIAAGGKILGFSEKELALAFGIGGFFAPISSVESFFEPSQKIERFLPVKPMHGGMAAYAGVLSVLLTSEGFAGSPEILETTRRGGFLRLLADTPNLDRILLGLGERYEIEEAYLKPYTACRHTHGGIQAALQIVSERKQTFAEFKEVRVGTYKVGKVVVGDRYTSPESNFVTCQFSLPYMVTVALLDGQVGPEQLSEARIGDARVHELARRVTVDEDLSFTEKYPEKTSTAIEVHLQDGSPIRQFVEIPKGDPRNPLLPEEIQAKFIRITKRLLSAQKQKKLIQAVERLEEMKDIAFLTRLLSTPRKLL
jgi:2-methylcitrate dehydratase PrpD